MSDIYNRYSIYRDECRKKGISYSYYEQWLEAKVQEYGSIIWNKEYEILQLEKENEKLKEDLSLLREWVEQNELQEDLKCFLKMKEDE